MKNLHWLNLPLLACLLAGLLTTSVAKVVQDITPPSFVAQSVANATLAGEGQMRFLGWPIYDVRLWVSPDFSLPQFGDHALALELTYRRAFTAQAIAKRSVSEMQRQRPIPSDQADQWQQSLQALMPDVRSGDRLTGVYQPGQGMQLWRGAEQLGSLSDPELARLFFGIWLSPNTSEPGLRAELSATLSKGAP